MSQAVEAKHRAQREKEELKLELETVLSQKEELKGQLQEQEAKLIQTSV